MSRSFGSLHREHFILESAGPVTEELVGLLTARGVDVLGFVPDRGVSVSIGDSVDLSDLPITFVGKLQAGDKLSAKLDVYPYAVVEFHPDVDVTRMRKSLSAQGLSPLDRRGLLAVQAMVATKVEQLAQLANDDAVAFIFPASPRLVSGEPLMACASGLTSAGRVAAFAAAYGNGWNHSQTLSYTFGPMSWMLPVDYVRQGVINALNEWAKYIQIGFWENTNRSAKRNIDMWFASGDHGDGLPFNPNGNVLAHTFYPAPPNPESIAGDMHFNADLNWSVGGEPDVFSLALHEAGHALGLVHSTDPNDVMYAFYKHVSGLTPNDVAVVRTLYAAKADPTLVINLQNAASPVTEPTATIIGNVDGGLGAVSVSWALGDLQGAAAGGRNWTIASIPLAVGMNTIQLTATDADGNVAVATVSVEQTAPDSLAPSRLLDSDRKKQEQKGQNRGLLQRKIK